MKHSWHYADSYNHAAAILELFTAEKQAAEEHAASYGRQAVASVGDLEARQWAASQSAYYAAAAGYLGWVCAHLSKRAATLAAEEAGQKGGEE